jgi:hypothetical protein
MVSVRFRWSPRQYREVGTVYRSLIELATGESTVLVDSPRQTVDLEMVSTLIPLHEVARLDLGRVSRRIRTTGFGQRTRSERLNPIPRSRHFARSSIWFSGENVRPPFGDWDGYLSFDVDPLGGRNAYFPLWWEALSVVGRPGFDFLGQSLSVEACLRPRKMEASLRQGFVCVFMGNPTPERLHAVEALNTFGTVDVFGPAVGKPVGSKLEVAKNYKFVLCFENDYYPGYVTEKVFDAWGTGAVPIWWGCDPEGYVNPAAVVNLADFSGIEEMSETVAKISADRETWKQMASAPILTRPPSLRPALEVITRALGS